jgi:hypothetical protein
VRAAITLIGVCLVTACARPDYAERWSDRLTISGGPQPGYAIKRIIEKLHPITLIADDGSICRTSAERFTKTAVGKWIGCAWALPSLDSVAPVGKEKA